MALKYQTREYRIDQLEVDATGESLAPLPAYRTYCAPGAGLTPGIPTR